MRNDLQQVCNAEVLCGVVREHKHYLGDDEQHHRQKIGLEDIPHSLLHRYFLPFYFLTFNLLPLLIA